MDSAGRERTFKLRGGVPCLDFVNTLAWRLTDSPVEYLGSYEDLLAWGRQAGLLAPDETKVLCGWAATDPEEAGGTLSRAVALREAVHRVLTAAISGDPRTRALCRRLTWSSRRRSRGCAWLPWRARSTTGPGT